MTTRRWPALICAALLVLSATPLRAQSDDEAPAPAKKVAAPASAPTTDPAAREPHPGAKAPTISGLSGLFRTVTTDIGSPHTFRIGLHMEAFKSSSFLVNNDSNSRFIGTIAASYTPWQYLEFFLNVRSTSNSNDRAKEVDRLDQPVILALGDLSFGGKGQYPIHRAFALGGNFGVSLLNSVGGTTFNGDATGFTIGLISTFDLEPLANFPLRFHLNAGYQLDNSYKLATFKNYSLASLQVEKFALGLNPSRMQIRFGIDLPLRRYIGFGLTPIIEVAADIATGESDLDFDNTRFRKPAGPLDQTTIDGRTTAWLTLGVRVNPVGGFLVGLASDIGMQSPGYGFGPPVVPWNLIIGLGYAYDPLPPTKVVTKETVKEVVREAERPKVGKFRGRVINAKTLEPIEGAIVTLPGKDLTGLSTDPDGSFLSYELPPGPQPIMVRHPDYLPGKLTVEIKIGAIAAQDIKLEAAPPKFVKVSGKVSDAKGNAIAATISVTGPDAKSVSTDAGGLYSLELKPGTHSLAATADGYLRKEQVLSLAGPAPASADFTLSVKPKKSLVKITKKELVITKQVHFGTNNATILPDSAQLLDSIIDVLLSNTNIKKIEIGGHTDNRGKPDANLQLSQARADSVRDYLTKGGVPADRLVGKGYGQTKPKVPNITPGQRAKNRRVEFLILEQ